MPIWLHGLDLPDVVLRQLFDRTGMRVVFDEFGGLQPVDSPSRFGVSTQTCVAPGQSASRVYAKDWVGISS